jgi:hypothetical protein
MMQSNWKQALFSFAIFYSANLFSQTTTADSTAEGIDEVIVVGYSKSTKKELTGAVGSHCNSSHSRQTCRSANHQFWCAWFGSNR